jgi:nucleoid-associated protein YgaU
MFEPNSRYAAVEDATMTVTAPDGTTRVVRYKRRRPIPPPGGTALTEHTVAQGERLDQLAARYLGDPTQFWKLCDANGVLDPRELEAVGRVVVIGVRLP